DTTLDRPFVERNGRIPVHQEKIIEEEINKNLGLGIIRPSRSPWCSRIVLAPKPDGSWRMCVDFRSLNKITVKDRYTSQRIDEIYDELAGARMFSVLDATSGYYQIAMEERDKEKTAFSYKGKLYEFNRMPFGLCNASATFQRVMDTVFRDENRKFVIPYQDDVIVYSKNHEDHEKHLRIALGKLRAAGICLNLKKCKFFRDEVKILGNIITGGEIKIDPEKTEQIRAYPTPTDIAELRSFLGMVNYCREFITGFADLTKPLYELLAGEKKKSTRKIVLDEKQREAFNTIKDRLCRESARAQPDIDKDFILTTDASDYGIGAVLTQKDRNNKERMVSAFSKKLDKCQRNYSVTDKELLALVKGVERYRHYLLGRPFILKTDHQALTYLWDKKNTTGRLLRWALKLAEYDFKIEYIKGETNIADGFSRIKGDNNVCELREEITEEDRKEILEKYHEYSGHGSVNTMKFMISQRYEWKGMFRDIELFCEACKICIRDGEQRVNSKNRVICAEYPNHLWEVDLMGKTTDDEGPKLIFVAIDHFTKWVETKVIERKTAGEISKAVEELIIRKHGIPTKILSDNGLEFDNKQIRCIGEKYNFEWVFGSPYHHQTTGAVERVIQTIRSRLRRMSDFGRERWIPLVEKATMAYNLSFNRAIGTSPYIFKNGAQMEFQIDKKYGRKAKTYSKQDLIDKRNECFGKYNKDISKGNRLIKRDLKIGDRVLIFRDAVGDKMAEKWWPGYVITDLIGEDAYMVRQINGNLLIRVNKRHIKRDTSFSE
ncbi:Retrovirus-related Pol polyprotein from transposon, partial [Nosema granulosis]